MDNLLVVGDMMVDTDVYVTQAGYCRETGCSRMVEHSKVERLGGAGNAALLAAYLKVAGAVSLVSPGFWPNPGKLSHKVERGDVPFWWHQLRGSEYPTRTRYVDLATNKVVLRLDSNPNPETAYDCVGEADSLIISQKIVGAPEPQFARMLISDYGRMPTPLHKGLRDSLPKVVVANVKDLLADRWKWLPPRTVGVCNRYELLKAYQRLRDTAGYNVPQMVSVVGKEWGRNLVVTCGEDGVYHYNNRSGTVYLWPVPRVTETPQIVGAGDMFSAAFTVKLSHHADIQDVEDTAFAIRYGIAAASVYVRSERGAKITDGECRSALDQYHLARVRCGLGDLAADVTSPTISDRPIVFTNGCFDLLHAGHRQLLAQCVKDPATRALVVAVNTDESVRSLKGSERPVRSIHSRVMDVAYAIDPKVRVKVMAFDGNVTAAIRSLGMRPAELVKGDEYAGQDIPGAELCDTVTLYPMVEGHSTSRLVGR